MSTDTTPKKTCPFCNKKGLPILPVRYAVARSDMGNAPALEKPFDATAGDESLALSGKAAHYTTRLLRPGYLYVYDEHRKEWTAYMVTGGGYLFQFDPYAKPPPGGWGKQTFACSRKGDAMIARCITVKDAGHATKIWLAFSDVAWTPAVMERHATEDYRKAHMQCLDIAQWRGGGAQPHAAPWSQLSTHVAEYATHAKALVKDTTAYVKRFLPEAISMSKAFKLKQEAARNKKNNDAQMTSIVPRLVDDMLDTVHAGEIGLKITPRVTAAWAFSPQPVTPLAEHAEDFDKWGKKTAHPWRPAMLALDDPAGIAMDLNGLALQRIAEVTAAPDYHWKFDTAMSITALRKAVREHAAKATRGRGEEDGLMTNLTGHPADHREWPKYAARIHEDQLDTYLSSRQDDLQTKTQPLVDAVDAPYLAWLDSAALKDYFTHNFDTGDVDSGHAYTDLATLILHQASGRTKIASFLAERLGKDPHDPAQWPARALTLNQDTLIAKGKTLTDTHAPDWDELADKIKDLLLSSIAMGNAGKLDQLGGSIARYIYHVAGPMAQGLNQALDTGAANTAALLPRRMQVGLLGALAKVENPKLRVVDMRGMWNRKQATRTLARMLASYAGGDDLMYRSDVRKVLDGITDATGKKLPYRGIILLDETEAGRLAGLSGKARTAAIGTLVLKPEQYEQAMEKGMSKLGGFEIKAGVAGAVFAAVTVGASFSNLLHAGKAEFGKQLANFASGLSTLTGGIFETAGKVVEKQVENLRLAGEAEYMLNSSLARARWLEGAGKWFGVIGGVIASIWMGVEGFMEFGEGEHALGAVHMTLALIGGAAVFLLLSAELAFIGIVIGLLVAIIDMVINWVRDDKLQIWLNKSAFFGRHEDPGWFDGSDSYEPFENPMEQRKALAAVLGEN